MWVRCQGNSGHLHGCNAAYGTLFTALQEVHALAGASMFLFIPGYHITLRARNFISPLLHGRGARLPRATAAAFEEPPP